MVDLAVSGTRLLAFCMVTYKQPYPKTKTYQSLQVALQHANYTDALIIVCDNTDIQGWSIDGAPLTNKPTYLWNPGNPGVSVAYNEAANIARQQRAEWIIFLDQDTDLPPDAIVHYLDAIRKQPDVLIKAPLLLSQGQMLSPARVVWRRCRPWSSSTVPGVYPLAANTLLNSGLMVNMNLFFKAGGYNKAIRLDFADHQFIDRVRMHTERFELLPISFAHDFSQVSNNKAAALHRYNIFVRDLAALHRESLSDWIGYLLIDLNQVIKFTLRFKTLAFIRIRLRVRLGL